MAVGIEPAIDELYRELIIDHWRRPRNKGTVDDAQAQAEGTNPVCGDEVSLTWSYEGDDIGAIKFEGKGCSICMASASMMCQAVEKCTTDDARVTAHKFRNMLIKGGPSRDLGDLEALSGVAAYPVRIKCAVLPWNALLQGLGEAPGDD
jgi:nitrogen fixation protein NifU and related proteins